MMRIEKVAGIKVAEKVLKEICKIGNTKQLKKLLGRKLGPCLYVQCFDNCREQGYCLTVSSFTSRPLHISFCENRNSDNIVVYFYTDIAFPSNLPAENAWDDKKYFRYDEHALAALYIYERIKNQLVKEHDEEVKNKSEVTVDGQTQTNSVA